MHEQSLAAHEEHHITGQDLLKLEFPYKDQIARTNPRKHARAEYAEADRTVGADFRSDRICDGFFGREEDFASAPRGSLSGAWAHQGFSWTVCVVIALPSSETRALHSPVIRRCWIHAPATGTVRATLMDACEESGTRNEVCEDW
jgi:hypothetical protein